MTDTPASSAAHGPGHETPDHHEKTDVNVFAILTFGAGLILSAILIQGMVWLMFQFFSARESVRTMPAYPLAAGQQTRVPPEPRLQTDPRADLRELRGHENTVLSTYGWVDKAAGVVRIPVEDAMRITAQRGLPARPGPGDTQK